MPLSRSFHDGVVERAKSDADFRRSLLRESVDAMLNCEFEVGYRLIRDYTQSVQYLDSLAEEMGLESEAVHTVFDPEVNVGGIHLFAALLAMLQHEGLAMTTRRQLGVGRRPFA